MRSKSSMFATFVLAATLGAAAPAQAEVRPAAGAQAALGSQVVVHVGTAGTGSATSGSHTAAFGAAAAASEESLPDSNFALMLLAALAAMGSVVVRRSGAR